MLETMLYLLALLSDIFKKKNHNCTIYRFEYECINAITVGRLTKSADMIYALLGGESYEEIMMAGLETISRVELTLSPSCMTYQDDTVTTYEKHIRISLDDLKSNLGTISRSRFHEDGHPVRYRTRITSSLVSSLISTMVIVSSTSPRTKFKWPSNA
jgi:hypothetical protein